ncbi:hypothetical protein V6Z11_D06G143700 [Gossypium hirsutum]
MWVKFTALSSILSHLLLSTSLVEAFIRCYDTGNFTINSTYGGFFTANVGQNAYKVYALGMCRGDSSPDDCYKCVNSTIHDLIANCPNQKEALSWEGQPCHVHYADRSFYGTLEELGNPEAGYNTGDIKSNLTEFDRVWESLMDTVVTNASNGSSTLKYAIGETDFIFQKIYVLMQCTPDLSHEDCDSCVRQSVSNYESCCHGKQGGYVTWPSCYFRWDLYPFYSTATPSPFPDIQVKCPHWKEAISLAVLRPCIVHYANRPFFGNVEVEPTDAAHNNESIKSDVPTKFEMAWDGLVIPLGASLSATLGLALFSACGFFIWRRRNVQEDKGQEVRLLDLVMGSVPRGNSSENFDLQNIGRSQEFPSIQLNILQAATNNFCDENKLGQGGFGPGTLADGKEIAVKRLSRNSGQGLLEFKNEVMLIAKLQHRNLVRLLGCCLEKNEKLLVYEFMPNKSLDVFLFDSSLPAQLVWQKRFNIIKGTARGIMYLHEDSHLRIIHRDLKASNVLLDQEMNPKISDFGMAKIFGRDQNEANTNRVVGTYGYMAPEYAMEGLFSVKSDVFSFGVLLLEIISGKRNNGFHLSECGESLLTFAWKLWSKGEGMELLDKHLVESGVPNEVLKCIQIGLLCVQSDPADRPTMSTVVAIEPAFYVGRFIAESVQPNSSDKICSVNEVTISNMSPR